MIKSRELLPYIYTKDSRDFQLFEHMLDGAIAPSLLATEQMANFPLSSKSDRRFLELYASTIGFEISHTYHTETLYSFLSVFKSLVRNKGTNKAITLAINTLLSSQHNIKESQVAIDKENFNIVVHLPNDIYDSAILDDVFDYILPTGFTYTIYTNGIMNSKDQTTSVEHEDRTSKHVFHAEDLSSVFNPVSDTGELTQNKPFTDDQTIVGGDIATSVVVGYEGENNNG